MWLVRISKKLVLVSESAAISKCNVEISRGNKFRPSCLSLSEFSMSVRIALGPVVSRPREQIPTLPTAGS